MRKELLTSITSLLFPMGLYAAPTMTAGAYQRTYMRASSTTHQPWLRAGYTLSVKPPKNLIENASQLDVLAAQTFRELLIIDAAVPQKHLLRSQLKPGVDVVELNAKQDGLRQLEALLSNYHNLQAVHIVSHAREGRVQLGAAWLDASIIKDRIEFFSSLNNAIKNGGDLLFYGCDLAAGEQGDEFLNIIASNTHVDIAASNDVTGGAARGGDWDLEIRRGVIDGQAPFSEAALKDFISVLAITDGGGGTINFDGISSSAYHTGTYTYNNVLGSGYNLVFKTDRSSGNEIYAYKGGFTDLYVGLDGGGGISSVQIYFSGGQSFDISSLDIFHQLGSAKTFTISGSTSNNETSQSISTGAFDTFALSNQTGVTSVTLTVTDSSDINFAALDNLVMSNVSAPNTTPAISINDVAKDYTEGDPLVQVDNLATLTDADGDADWDGGTLEAQITANNMASDTLTIGDNVVGLINTSGTNLLRSATVIGTLSASEGTVTNGAKLTITFNSNATNTWVQQTLRAIQYVNSSDDPGASRTVTFTATDKNSASASDTRTIAIGERNDEPTLTATASNPTFTEGGAAASLFTSASASTVEAGQTISALTLTVTNVNDGSNERLNADGTAIVLTHGTNGTTASNSLSYSVSVIGTTATVVLSGGTLSTAATQTMVNALSYQNNSQVPNTSNRVVTLTSVQDSGGTANGGDNTAALAIASTVTMVGVNDEPTLTATGSNPTFTEGGAAASLFSGSSVSTIESGQTISAMTMTVTNVNDGSNERLNADGTAIVLTNGTSGTTATNSLSYSVSVSGSTATVTLSGGTMSTAATQTLVDALSYQNNSQTPNTSNRVVTLTSVQDSGGTANGGDDTAALAVASTVTMVGVNDEPTLTATGSNPTFTEGGAAASLFSGSSVSTIESGQTISALTMTVTNVNDGSNERLNADGTTIVLTHGTSGTTASNSLSYSVSVVGTTATVSLTGGTLSTAATQTMVNALSYQNNSSTPNTSNRVVTITSLQDSGGTANGGDNTAALAVASTVTVTLANNEPTLTATGSNPTFTEGSAAASLYSGSSVSTIEGGQTISALTMTVTNVNNGSNEILNTDGSAIALTNANSGTTATNSLSYSVSVIGTTATVSLSGGTLSTAATQTLVDALSYQNNAQDPNTSNRVVTITALQDSGGTANGGDDTAALAVASTVTVVAVNDEPILTATASNPTFTAGGAAASIFTSASASTIEAGQTLSAMTVTVTNVNDGSDERLNVDGTAIVLTNGTSGTTATNSLSYSVSVVGTTATLTLSGATISAAATQTLVDAISYQNNNLSPNTSDRVVTITSLQDSGGTANGGDNTTALAIVSTVTVALANSAPVITEGASVNVTMSEDGVPTAFSLTLNVTDANHAANQLTWSINSAATNGSASASGTGLSKVISYTPTLNYNGSDSFVVRVTDGTDNDDITVNVTIQAVADNTDTDGDGISDAQELIDGTDPNDRDEYLDTTAPVVTPPTNLIIDAVGLFTSVTLKQLLGLASTASQTEVQTAANALATDNADGDDCCSPTVVSLSNNKVVLPPGRNTVTWRATDRKGNVAQATQIVNVRPLVSLSKDQVGVEGAQAQFRIILNGPSPFYPLRIPFVIDASSTADQNDHDLTATEAVLNADETSATVNINLLTNAGVEADETLRVRLDDQTTNAQDLANGYDENNPDIYDINSGFKTQHSLTITEGNVPPKATLLLQQNSINTIQVTPGGGPVTITATVVDPNVGETHQYDWSSTSAELSDNDADVTNNVFMLDPSSLSTGLYKMQVSVSDAASAVDTTRLYFRVVAALPVLSNSDDTDGDGIDDMSEGTADGDNDGIPDYLDNIAATNVLPEVALQTNSYLLECDPGVLCRLGRFSLRSESGGAGLVDDDIAAQDDLTEDDEFTYDNGIFDFEIHELPIVGTSAHIVIPQTSAIPANAVYRKFQNDEWSLFAEDANNIIHSSLGELGYCPPPEDDAWEIGLIEGYYCVQLTIEDGGPNDADGEANASIEDPGGVAKAVAPASISISSQIKGGGVTAWSFLFGLVCLALVRIKRSRKSLLASLLLLVGISNTQADMLDDEATDKWFLELAFFQASGSHTSNDFVSGVASEGINITLNRYDNDRVAYQVQVGYQYLDSMALEFGYLDLGDVTVNFDTTTTDTTALSQALSNHYPISSSGWVIANRFDLYTYKKLSTSAEIGAYVWDSKVDLSGINISPDIGGDTDLLIGLNVNYILTKRYAVGLKWQRIFFEQQEVDSLGAELKISW